MKKVLSMVLVVALLSLSAVALAETHGLGISTSIASSKPATAGSAKTCSTERPPLPSTTTEVAAASTR